MILSLAIWLFSLYSCVYAGRNASLLSFIPTEGTASTTQFTLGTEFGGGTACGMDAWPKSRSNYTARSLDGRSSSSVGPGFLYAAINQLAFGSPSSGGPGPACGACYTLTPMSSSGKMLTTQALSFMIVDNCPVTSNGGGYCGQCREGMLNLAGQEFHFDIASDAMSRQQYNTFFNGATDGKNWDKVHFNETKCSSITSPDPPIKDWGCLHDCKSNDELGMDGACDTGDDVLTE